MSEVTRRDLLHTYSRTSRRSFNPLSARSKQCSSSPRRPYPVCAMLPALPTEILKQIIESAVPRSFQTETYSARQETLRTLSLVSKRFHAIARPLLCQVAWIKSMKQFKTLHKSAAGAGQGRAAKNWFTIRAIIGSDSHTCFSRHLSIGPQLGQMVSIRHLTLSGLRADIVDWDLLASLPSKALSSLMIIPTTLRMA